MLIAADPTVLKILLVEHNPAEARLVVELFRDCSAVLADVRHVSTIAEACDALADEAFDAVLLDLSLPDGFGIATVRRVRATAPHVPIIVLSGHGDEAAAMAAVTEGAQDYLLKSQIDDAGLLRAIRHAIGRHELMRRIAYYDPLTGLPNRAAFREGVNQALARAQRYAEKMALLFIDLDGFKRINGAYGHETGDAVLRAAADRIRESLRASDFAARYGGDEFAVMLPFIESDQDAAFVAEKLRERISAPLSMEGNDVTVGASIGVALFPEDGRDVDSLTLHADDAMYRAKRRGVNPIALRALG
jgi:two-component system cell cycle response regulator